MISTRHPRLTMFPTAWLPKIFRSFLREPVSTRLLLSGWLCACLLWSSVASAAPQVVDGIYLIVNQQIFTFSEAQEARAALRQQLIQEGRPGSDEEVARRVEERLLAELLLRSRAKALQIEATTEEVRERLDLLREQNPQVRMMDEGLLQEQIADDLRRQRLLSREVDAKVRVEESEVLQFCEAQRVEQRQIELSQILLRDEEIPERVQIIQEQFAQGMDFAELAQALSDDPAAERNGGRLGNFRKGELLPAIEQVAFALPVGELSTPVTTEFGTHLLLVQSETLPEELQCDSLSDQQRQQFEDRAFQQQRQQAVEDYIQGLRQKAQITVNPFPKGWNG